MSKPSISQEIQLNIKSPTSSNLSSHAQRTTEPTYFSSQNVINLKRLTMLNLADCKIGDSGFNELYTHIKENSHLKVLNLSMNNLTE